MAGRTLKSLVSRRRRAGDEGEDDDGPVIVGDSQSEGSVLSDGDEDEVSSWGGGQSTVEEGADVKAEGDGAEVNSGKKARELKKGKRGKDSSTAPAVESPQTQSSFKAMADTDAMMNGLRIDDAEQTQGAVDFDSMEQNGASERPPATSRAGPINGNTENAFQRQRREHEDYKKKRDENPAFIPNRGNFFMHDTRGQPNGQAPAMRGGWAGRGRGRVVPPVGGPFSPANQSAQSDRAAERPWKHDLHDTINEEPLAGGFSRPDDPARQFEQNQLESARVFGRPVQPPSQSQPRVLSFSSTTLVGKVQIRVLLPGMKAPISFSEVPWKHYIRLPNHRPPLRRDKPVRVSIPDRAQQYIFPSADRSFIFIPRQNRPNQPGYHRGSYQRSIGGYGYSSRRTSMYGGSAYAPSIAASRRSSLAGISRADAFSPTSFASGMGPAHRPVVRLPHGYQPFSGMTTPSGPLSGQHTPTGMQIHTYPLPQQPTFQGTPTSTVHQPRPQKQISVTGIESPALLHQQNGAGSTEPQPFQNQLPAHMTEQAPGYSHGYYSPRQQYAAYASQPPQHGTPLGGIPEQAMHAPYPPSAMQTYGHAPYYQQYPAQQAYYYSPPGPGGYPPPMPMYMPPQGYGMMPPGAPAMPSQPPPQQPPSQPADDGSQQQQGGQSDMMAQERNGMVFYVPRSDVESQQREGQSYQPAENFVPSYAMPGLPPPTPAPDMSSYYYPPMPQQMYYPTSQDAQQ